jgi:hypothetical protein
MRTRVEVPLPVNKYINKGVLSFEGGEVREEKGLRRMKRSTGLNIGK